MPLYDFDCDGCGTFSVLKPIARRDDPQACPVCGGRARRHAVTAPALACMPDASRHAETVNERARHEPRHRVAEHRHGSACSGASPAKAFPGRRPWMLSH